MAQTYFTPLQIADLLGTAPHEVEQWVRDGLLPQQNDQARIGRIARTDFENFLRRKGIDIRRVLGPQEPTRPSGDPDATTLQIADAILADAVKQRATHIHLSLRDDRLTLALRIDGVMVEKPQFASRLPQSARKNLTAHFKSLVRGGELKPATFSRTFDGRAVEFSLIRLGTLHGEKLVITVAAQPHRSSQTSELWDQEQEAFWRNQLRHPEGLILLAAPARADRNALLAALKTAIDATRRSAARLDHRNEVHSATTPSDTLRRLLLADTEIILIAELTSAESILAAIHAAEEALVIAIVAGRDTREALALLLDSSAPVWPLTQHLRALVTARTLRRSCPHCKTGCDRCSHTGYHGLLSVQAAIEMNDSLATLLRRGALHHALDELTRQAGIATLYQAAQAKVSDGHTRPEEVIRVFGTIAH